MLKIVSSIILSLVVAYCFGQGSIDIKSNPATLSYIQTVDGVPQNVSVTMQKTTELPVVTWNTSKDASSKKQQSYSSNGNENGTRMYLTFDSKTIPTPDATVLWVCKRNFLEISYGKTTMNLNNDIKVTGTAVIGKENIKLKINGTEQTMEAYHLKSVGTTQQEIWIINNINNPIVLKAVGIYNIELKEINL